MQQERKRQRTEISDDGASLVTFSKTGVEDDEIRIQNLERRHLLIFHDFF
jgi:hypothetical protein